MSVTLQRISPAERSAFDHGPNVVLIRDAGGHLIARPVVGMYTDLMPCAHPVEGFEIGRADFAEPALRSKNKAGSVT